METLSKVFAGATPEVYEDLLLTGMPPVNLLLTGRHAAIQIVLEMLLRDSDEPVSTWYPGERLVLPRNPRSGILILHEVGHMSPGEQVQVLEWLERGVGRAQIVSTSSVPLMPHVENGAFNDILYYRLNTVSVYVAA